MSETKEPWIYPNLPPVTHRKVAYKTGPSLLDSDSPDSQLNKSNMKGFFNLIIIFCAAFLVTEPISKYLSQGVFFQSYLYQNVKTDFESCLIIWPIFFAWSFTSYFLQKLILRDFSQKSAFYLQHLTQSGLFIFSTYVILTQNWCSSHGAFIILHACVHFMKMHSYTTVNRDYREQYLDSMKNNRKSRTNYPNNINIKDFALFMATPWLVYHEYPRKSKINYFYLLKKGLWSLILLSICYIVYSEYIMPWILLGDSISFIQLLIREMLPSTIFILLMFVLTFEHFTNFFAELTRLDYRQFYQDWWNSTTYQEFNRKWNKPVHDFLYRHVYLECIIKYKLSKAKAQMITFFFSAALHEFLFAMIFRIVMPIFLGFIIFQLPLIYFTKFMIGRKSGNYLFWLGLILGPSLIVSSYLRVNSDVTKMFTKL